MIERHIRNGNAMGKTPKSAVDSIFAGGLITGALIKLFRKEVEASLKKTNRAIIFPLWVHAS